MLVDFYPHNLIKIKTKKNFVLDVSTHSMKKKIWMNIENTVIQTEEVIIDMPKEENKYIYFNNFNNKMKVPFVIYADFESCLIAIHTCSPDKIKSFTNKYQTT